MCVLVVILILLVVLVRLEAAVIKRPKLLVDVLENGVVQVLSHMLKIAESKLVVSLDDVSLQFSLDIFGDFELHLIRVLHLDSPLWHIA